MTSELIKSSVWLRKGKGTFRRCPDFPYGHEWKPSLSGQKVQCPGIQIMLISAHLSFDLKMCKLF